MTPTRLRVLVALADTGSFTAAADELGLSQPSVSRTVALLEREVGTALFVRRPAGAALTQAGVVAVHHARAALSHLDRLREEVALLEGGVIGALRIASLPSATGSFLAAPLRRFSDRHPAVEVSLFEGTDGEVRQWLDQGAADLGVVTLPAPGRQTVELGRDEMVVVVPPHHRLASAQRVRWTQLRRERFIMPTGGCGPLILDAAEQAGVALAVAFEAREPQSLVQMVRAGVGVTVMPTLNLPADPGPARVLPLSPRLGRSLALAVAEPATPAARAFCTVLSEGSEAPAS